MSHGEADGFQIQTFGASAYGQDNYGGTALSSGEQSSHSDAWQILEGPVAVAVRPLINEASKADAIGSPRLTTVVISTMIILMVIVMAVAIIVISQGIGSKDEKVKTHEDPEISKDDLGDGTDFTMIVPELRISMPPTNKLTLEGRTGHVTAAPAVSANTVKETAFTIPTSPNIAHKRNAWQSLLCTVGSKLNTADMLPYDGLCDYIFYDSVYKRSPMPFDPNNIDATLSIFLGERPNYNTTSFGIGFAYKYRRELKLQLSTNSSATMLKFFWERNICNFGILDTPTNGLHESSLEEILENLKLLDDFSISQRSKRMNCLTVFAGPAADTTLENIYVQKFSQIFTPNVVVILSHYGQGDNTLQDCHVMPPTVLTRPPALGASSSYKEDMRTAADTISKLIGRGVDTSWALSVTMKGRWTVLKAGQPADFLSRCEHDPSAESFGSYADVCSDSNLQVHFRYNSTVRGTLFRTLSDGRVFAFDHENILIEKLCRVKAQHTSIAFGIAAFDIDYEDFEDTCEFINSYGVFSRLYTLEDVLEFFVEKYRDSSAMHDCLSLNDYT